MDIWYIWVSAITKKKSPAFWAREKLFLATPISERGNFNCKNEKSHTYATMANVGSIPMFSEMANRLQSLVLPQNHYLTHFDHTLLWASHNFDQKIWKFYTYATIENEGSIPMYFEATNRLQPLALPQHHHLTHFDHTLLWASHNFDQKILYLCYYGKCGHYFYVFWGNKSITAISFTPKSSFDHTAS